jgi:hypothetical protein
MDVWLGCKLIVDRPRSQLTVDFWVSKERPAA